MCWSVGVVWCVACGRSLQTLVPTVRLISGMKGRYTGERSTPPTGPVVYLQERFGK